MLKYYNCFGGLDCWCIFAVTKRNNIMRFDLSKKKSGGKLPVLHTTYIEYIDHEVIKESNQYDFLAYDETDWINLKIYINGLFETNVKCDNIQEASQTIKSYIKHYNDEATH